MAMESNSKGVAVVGASSQIGQALISRLVSEGYLTYRIGRKDRNYAKHIGFHIFDESTCQFTPSIESVGTVISLAPLPSIEVVVKMAYSLKAKRIIAFGSTGRFSKLGSESQIEQDFVAQQVRAENLFSMRCEAANLGWTLFRPTMIYGADADQNVTFIRSMIKTFGFFPIPIGANGLRQPVHVNDLAGACVSALACEVTINKAYNLGGGEVLGFQDFVKKIFRSEAKRPLLIPIPTGLFFLIISIAQKFSKTAFVRTQMVERMFKDLTVDNDPATVDFDYDPQPFLFKK